LSEDARQNGISIPGEHDFKTKEFDTKHPFSPFWNYGYCTIERYKLGLEIPFFMWFEKFIKLFPYESGVLKCVGSIFAVRKENILQHSKEYYQNLCEQVNWHIDPVEGHFMERSWYYIFEK